MSYKRYDNPTLSERCTQTLAGKPDQPNQALHDCVLSAVPAMLADRHRSSAGWLARRGDAALGTAVEIRMTLESMLSDTKYAFRALRNWLKETTGHSRRTSRPPREVECQHRVLIGHSHYYLYSLPCADCGKRLVLSDFASRWGRFYAVAAEQEEED